MPNTSAERRHRTLFLAIGAALLLALGLAWILSREEHPGGSAPLADARAESAPEDRIAPPREPAAVAQRAESSEEAEPVAPPPPVAAAVELARVRGRCVRAEDGGALEGAVVKFDGWGANAARMALSDKPWQDPEPVTTDAEGRFEIAFDPPSGLQFSLDIAASGRTPRTGRWGRIEARAVIELGEIALARGYEVRGRVVDEVGQPVAKIGVSLMNLPLPISGGMAANNQRSGWSDEAGEFVVDIPVPPGTWSVEAERGGWKHVSPDRVSVLEGAGAEPLLVRVKRMPKIEGLVVDDLGEPVAGVYLNADLRRSGRMCSTYSRKDGTFTLYAVDDEPQPIRILIEDAKRCEQPLEPDPSEHAWGTSGLRIVLQRTKSFELEVVERDSGKPVERYAVRCFSERARWSNQREARLSGEHPQGRVTVDQVSRGKTHLAVIALDPELLPSEERILEIGDEAIPPQRIELVRMQPYGVRVTSTGGDPVEGAEVEVIERGSQELDIDASVQTREGGGVWSSDPSFRNHVQRALARTGADGRARVLAPRTEGVLALRVTHPQHPRVLLQPVELRAEQDAEVVLPEGAAIAGRVITAGHDPRQLSLCLQTATAQPGRYVRPSSAKLDGEGRFRFEGLRPDTYRPTILLSIPYRTEGGGHSGSHELPLAISEIVARAGEVEELVIDVSSLAPARVRGRVLVDGAPPAAGRLSLQLVKGPVYGQFVPDAQGQFEAGGLLPGTYKGRLTVGDFRINRGQHIESENELTLAAGTESTVELRFVLRRLVVRLRDRDGTSPLARARVSWNHGYDSKEAATDADGVLVIEPAPPGEISIFLQTEVEGRPRGELLGKVAVPEGAKSHEAELRRGAEGGG